MVENKRSLKPPPSLLTNTWGCAIKATKLQSTRDAKTPPGSATVCNLCCPLTRTWHHRSTVGPTHNNIQHTRPIIWRWRHQSLKYHNLHKSNHIKYWWVLLGPQIPSWKPHIKRCIAKVFHLNASLHHSPVTFSTSAWISMGFLL